MLSSLPPRLRFTLLLSLSHTLPVLLHQITTQLFLKTGLFKRHLIQPPDKSPFKPDKSLFKSLIVHTLTNHLLKIPLLLYLFYPLLSPLIPLSASPLLLPPLPTLALHLAFSTVVEDCLFYWTHRLLHTPYLFKHVHSMHHRFHNLKGVPVASE